MSHPGTNGGAHLDDATLNDLADGRLGASDRAAADTHLTRCEECRAALDSVRQVIALGRTDEARAAAPLLTVQPPPELWPVVAATTLHERLVRRHVLRSMRGTLAVAAVALVATSSAATVGVMRLLDRAAELRSSGLPPLPSLPSLPPLPGRRSSAADNVRRATERQLDAYAKAEAATLRRIEPVGRRAAAERGLAALDSVLAAARAAALAAPGDEERLRVVEDVYRRRQDAIRRAR